MKLQKIFVAFLCILLLGAMTMSIVSIVNISDSFIKDNDKDGTSSDNSSSSSGNTGEPEGSVDTENYLEGESVAVAEALPDGTFSDGSFEVCEGVPIVRRIDDITYCYIKFDIPENTSELFVCYSDFSVDGIGNCVYRISYDQKNWYLLDEYMVIDGGGSYKAAPPRNGANTVYICLYTLTNSSDSLSDILSEFEGILDESLGLIVTNIPG